MTLPQETQEKKPVMLQPKNEIPYPLPSTWISKNGKVYVLLDYYYPTTEALLNLKPESVLVYSVLSEQRMVMPIPELNERIKTGNLTRITEA